MFLSVENIHSCIENYITFNPKRNARKMICKCKAVAFVYSIFDLFMRFNCVRLCYDVHEFWTENVESHFGVWNLFAEVFKSIARERERERWIGMQSRNNKVSRTSEESSRDANNASCKFKKIWGTFFLILYLPILDSKFLSAETRRPQYSHSMQ